MRLPRVRFYVNLDTPRSIKFTAMGGTAALIFTLAAVAAYEAWRYAVRGGSDWSLFFYHLFN